MRVWGVRVVPQKNVCHHMHGAEPAVWSIYCAVFTEVFFFFPFMFFFKSFFFNTLYPSPVPPCCSQCLARLKIKCILLDVVVARSGWASSHDVPMCHVEPMETFIHTDSGAGRRRCEFVCCRHQFVKWANRSPQSSSIHILFLRQVTKQWGWRLSQKTLLLLTYLSTI